MGIKPVIYNGQTVNIDQSNALEILKNRSSVTQEDGSPMSEAQIKWAERFLSEEELEEVFYSDDSSKTRGKDAMNLDADNDGEDDIKTNDDGSTDKDRGAGSIMASAGTGAIITGTILAMCKSMAKLKGAAATNGFTSLGAAIVACAGSVLCLTFSFANMFDNGFNTRKAFSEATNDNAATMDAQNDLLVGNMDLMNEDAALYEEQTTEYAEQAAGATNQMAALKVELDDAQAAGDTARVAEIQQEIQALQGEDFSGMEDGLQETRDRMEEYSSSALEAQGMTENGTKIAEFLDAGKSLKGMALTNAIALTAATVLLGVLAAIGVVPKLPFALDAPTAIASGVMWLASMAMMGVAAGKMWKNMSDEGKFGDNGDVMHEHITSLNDMIGQHTGYMDETISTYDGFDEEMEQNQQNSAAAATQTVTDKTGDTGSVRVGGVGEKDEEYKKKHKKGGSVEPTHKPKPQTNPTTTSQTKKRHQIGVFFFI